MNSLDTVGVSLLISGSKVRVLDGPPMKAGTSGVLEVPADFRSAVFDSVSSKIPENSPGGATLGENGFPPALPHDLPFSEGKLIFNAYDARESSAQYQPMAGECHPRAPTT
jgi:hypothetical protein